MIFLDGGGSAIHYVDSAIVYALCACFVSLRLNLSMVLSSRSLIVWCTSGCLLLPSYMTAKGLFYNCWFPLSRCCSLVPFQSSGVQDVSITRGEYPRHYDVYPRRPMLL